MSNSWKRVIGIALLGSLGVVACQPQVVEVEKEVVVTKEVQVEKEVEVEKIVEVEKVEVVEVEVEKVVEVEKIVEVEVEGEAPEADKTLVYVSPTTPISLDRCVIPGQQTAEIIQNTSWFWTTYTYVTGPDGLTMADTAGGEDAIQPWNEGDAHQPGVLESWESNEDSSVWTLTIRKGVLDELGREMKAADFVWNWDKTIQMGPCSYISNGINLTSTDQIEIIDDYTVKMDLGAPNPIFLRVLHVNNGMAIAPSVQDYDTADDPWAGDWLKTNVVALGPYKIDAFVPGEQVRLEKNPNWFGPEPDIDTVIYRQVPESANRVALLMSGDAHIARDLTQDELDEIAKVDGLTAQCSAANQFLYAAMNHLDGPTADVTVRQALAYAVPYQDIIDSAYRGRAGSMPGFHPPTYSDYLGEDAWPYETDYDKAKELLASAGYADGFEANIVVDSGVPEHESVAVLLQASFAEVGVDLQIDIKPTAAHRDVAFGRTFGDMVLDQNYAITLDPGYHAGVWLPDLEGGFNFGGFYDETFHTTLETGFQTPLGPERTEMMHTLQSVFNEQSVYLSLATVPTCFGMSDSVQNYVWHTHNQIVFSDLTLEE